jgi:hypothetical protein
MKTKQQVYKMIFGSDTSEIMDFDLKFEIIDTEQMDVHYQGQTVTLYYDYENNTLFNDEGEIIGSLKDLLVFNNFEVLCECQDCYGEGYYEDDISGQCSKYIGDCCGGCTATVKCDCENKPFNI